MYAHRDYVAEAILMAIIYMAVGLVTASVFWMIAWSSSYDAMIKRGFVTHNNMIYVVEPMKFAE